MNKHIFKLIWKRKRKSMLLVLEITIAFLVLFAVFTMSINNYVKYARDLGFEYKDVWVLLMNWKDEPEESAREKIKMIKQHIALKSEVTGVAISDATYPFSYAVIRTSVGDDLNADYVMCEPAFLEVLRISVQEGRTFTFEDDQKGINPVLLNKKLSDELFPDEDPIGKIVQHDERQFEVVGMVGNYRYTTSFMENVPVIFHYYSIDDTSRSPLPYILMRVTPGTGTGFEAGLMKELGTMVAGWDIEIDWLEDQRRLKDSVIKTPIIILVVVSAFLIINVALGLFGLLWYNISRRKAEIGLRRAMGASVSRISRQFVGEIMWITTLAVVIGLFFAVQFPALGVFNLSGYIYTLAIVFSVILIYGITYLCSYSPSRQASHMQPAEALREE